MALILTMLIVLVMLVLVGSMLSIITGELSSVSFAGFDNRALYSADAGVQFAQQQIDNYAANNATPPPNSTWNQTLPADPSGKTATFTVVMDPTPYLRNGNLYYLVHSEGKAPGGGDRKVDAILEVQSYTHYAYYTYQNQSGNYFVSGINSFDGPVYLQGTSNKLNFQWYNINKPIFLSTAIIAGNYGFSPSAPTTNSQWTQVIAGGSANLTQTSTTGYVSYPPIGSTYIAANQAFNGTSGASSLPTPATKDVYMNGALAKSGSGALTSGIFINGNVNIAMSSTTATNEIFTFTPVTSAELVPYSSNYTGDNTNTIPSTVTITVDYALNTTTVVEGASPPAHYSGVPQNQPTGSTATQNGSILVNGNVDSISGVVNGQYTIAVPDIQTSSTTNVDDIVVTNNITYKSDPTTGPSDDVLGMMCDNFNLGPASITPNVLKIQSDIIAGNSYEASHNQVDGGFGTVDSVGSLPLKTSVNIYGSLVQNEVKPLGQFNSGSGLLVKGWSDTYNYDTRQMTPPDWPTLGTGLVAWKDAGSPIY
jgi:hypothetical protein